MNKEDRELLELVAKAARYPVDFESGDTNEFYANGYDDDGNVREYWNPLICDGDAFRLAVALKMSVSVYSMSVEVSWCDYDMSETFEVVEYDNKTNVDIYEATRRAITRAAAEMGRRM